MRTFTTRKGKALLLKLPMVLGCVLATSVYAQNAEQVKAIQEQSNLRELNAMKGALTKKMPNERALRKMAKQMNIPFSGETNGRFFQLNGFDEKTGEPIYYVTYNEGAAEGTQTNKLYSEFGVFDLAGENMKVYEWDGGGVLLSHQEFEGRVIQRDTPDKVSSHATHVAGTLVAGGVNPNARGMAYKATLNAYDWTSDTTEMIDAAGESALVSNHSYGSLGAFEWGDWSGNTGWHWWGAEDEIEYSGYGQYSVSDKNWDLITYFSPYYLPVKAAGNPRGGGPSAGSQYYYRSGQVWKVTDKVRPKNGGDDGYDCITRGSVTKNTLIVGAAKKIPNGYTEASDVEMASFSGYGPVDDGRIKPDITGIGVDLTSTWSTGNDQYNAISGTSMASPNVTGSLILLQELYGKKHSNQLLKSSTLKALVIGTANEAYTEGPDYASGWGLLNAYKAASSIELNGTYTLVENRELNNGEKETIEVTASGGEPLKVTIAWTDPAPLNTSSGLNDRTKMLVNDLDIKVNDGTIDHLAWVLDPEHPANGATKGDNNTDNVEQVVINNPVAGKKYTITVSHKGTLKSGTFGSGAYSLQNADSQEYGLVVTGINNGVTKDLTLKAVKVEVEPEEYTSNTPVKFTVENIGKEQAVGAKLRYTLTEKESGTQVSQAEVDLPTIAAGNATEKTVNIDLSKPFVDYEIKGEIIFAGDQVELNNKIVTGARGIVADLTPYGSSHSFDFEGEFEAYGWTSEDVNQDGKTWYKYNEASFAHSGKSFAISFPNQKGVNDWLFSNPLKLKANKKYVVIFYARKFQVLKEEIMLGYGAEAKGSAMTMIPSSKVEPGYSYTKYTFEFSVPSNQLGYVGFQHKLSNSYAVALDDVTIASAEESPIVNFNADKLEANSFEDVSFTSDIYTLSSSPVTAYEWSFSPNAVTYVTGSATSKDVTVRFNNEGTYAVTLKATSSKGQGTKTKTDYITISNEEVVADFDISADKAYTKERVVLRSTSTGNPLPTNFEWTVTPSEGVEFIDGTTNASKTALVQFSKPGTYSVKLKATSQVNSDVKEKTSVITVTDRYTPVKDLESTFDKATKELKLTWKKPTVVPMYYEEFNGTEIPINMTVLDANQDGLSWVNVENTAVSFSWTQKTGLFTADDWLITDKIAAGAEQLRYDVKFPYRERYDVYVVAAKPNGSIPSINEIKANGNKVVNFEATGTTSTTETKSIDISNYTGSDFYVAFHHKTTKADDGYYIQIDNVYVGYNDAMPSVTQRPSQNKMEKKVALAEDVLVTYEPKGNADKLGEFGATTSPVKLVGYEIVKNGAPVESKSDVEDRTYNETINATTGKYVYDVYAVYSDGVKSEKKTIEIDLSSLGTSDVKAKEGVQVYPNPSNGLFTVSLASDVSNFETVVYDLTGKLLFKKSFQGNTAELNLTQYSKGVYVLNVVDNNGEQKTVKLVIK